MKRRLRADHDGSPTVVTRRPHAARTPSEIGLVPLHKVTPLLQEPVLLYLVRRHAAKYPDQTTHQAHLLDCLPTQLGQCIPCFQQLVLCLAAQPAQRHSPQNQRTWFPFTASPSDHDSAGRQLGVECLVDLTTKSGRICSLSHSTYHQRQHLVPRQRCQPPPWRPLRQQHRRLGAVA